MSKRVIDSDAGELKPCPFCGCKYIEFHTYLKDDGSYVGSQYNSLRCVACSCGTDEYLDYTVDDLAEMWNARAIGDTPEKMTDMQMKL